MTHKCACITVYRDVYEEKLTTIHHNVFRSYPLLRNDTVSLVCFMLQALNGNWLLFFDWPVGVQVLLPTTDGP